MIHFLTYPYITTPIGISQEVRFCPACEILTVTPTIKNLIQKDETESIYDLVKAGSFNKMVTMNMSLYSLVKEGLIAQEDALAISDNENELKQMLRGVYHGTGLNNRT